MTRRFAFTLFLAALLVPLGAPATASPGNPGASGPARAAGPSGARPIPAPPRVAPPKRDGGSIRLPDRPRANRPLGSAPRGGDGKELEKVPDRIGTPATPAESTKSFPDSSGDDPGATQLAMMARAPRLSLTREPSPAPSPGQSRTPPPVPARVYLARHSVSATIRDGVAITVLNQVYHNAGDRIGEGSWNCPLPRGAAVTGFSIFVNGVEHPGRFLTLATARRIYDETVHKRRDPGLVQLEADGSVTVQIFPIPARGDMRIRMTWAVLLPESGSVSHYLLPLRDVAPRGEPALDGLTVDVDIETSLPLDHVFSQGPSLEEDVAPATNRWKGSLTRRDYRPRENLEVAYLLDNRSPRLAVRVETAPDGGRTFFAVVQASGHPLTNLALEFEGVAATDVFPAKIRKVSPWSRRYVFGRLPDTGPVKATLRAISEGDEVLLETTAVETTGTHLGALWAAREIEEMPRSGNEKANDALVSFAARFGILTRYNAILAEE